MRAVKQAEQVTFPSCGGAVAGLRRVVVQYSEPEPNS